MEIRELVRLKKGTGGLEPPLNMGILLDRRKSGKDFTALVFTLRGEMTVKWRSLKEAGGRIYPGDKKDEASMRRFIRESIEKERSLSMLRMTPEQIMERVSPEDLYKSVMSYLRNGGTSELPSEHSERLPPHCENVLLSPGKIGSIHFEPMQLDPKQQWAISRVLAECDDPSSPFFDRSDIGRKPYYAPHRKEAIESIREHIASLENLWSHFVESCEREEDEEERSGKRNRARFADPSSADLTVEMKRELDRICEWGLLYLEKGSFRRGLTAFGLGGTPVRRFHRFDLERFIFDLSHNMIGSRIRDPPSDIIGMLLKLRRVSWREASGLVVKFNLGSGRRTFHDSFPEHVERASSSLPEEVSEEEAAKRLDLRSLPTFTIDPPDARDFDDALSLEEGINGRAILWVHIADVSHYVRAGDLIDLEARYRGTSVYLPTGVIPMLPPRLSEDLCSLKEGADRLCISTRLELSDDGELLSTEHHRSVIRVDRNLSYDEVEPWIEEKRQPFSSLWELAEILEERHGRLDLRTPERKVTFSSDDSIEITIKRPTKATRLIEQFMILANEAAARKLRDNDLPVPYRVHPLPQREDLERFNAAAEALGLDAKIDIEWDGSYSSRDGTAGSSREGDLVSALLAGGKLELSGMSIQTDAAGEDAVNGEVSGIEVPIEKIEMAVDALNRVLRKIRSFPDSSISDILSIWMLRTLPRAFYSHENIGHFGLRSGCYCHFTSPIRRYPDILAHRGLASILEPGSCEAPESEEVSEILEHVNEMSDEAEEWEREMIDVALSTRAFMDEDFNKAPHQGRVMTLTPSSVFLLLEDSVTEGRVPLRTISPYRLHPDDTGTRLMLHLREQDDTGNVNRLRETGVEEMEVLRIGEIRRCGIFSVSVAGGTVHLSFMDPVGGD